MGPGRRLQLTSTGWDSQSFSDLLNLELDVYAATQRNRITLEGDDLSLSANSSMLMGLAIHELLTNALKYGAFSDENGKIVVTDKSHKDVFTSLTWKEKGGPPITPSKRKGFGTLLLKSILPSELEATASMNFETDGLLYELRAMSKI